MLFLKGSENQKKNQWLWHLMLNPFLPQKQVFRFLKQNLSNLFDQNGAGEQNKMRALPQAKALSKYFNVLELSVSRLIKTKAIIALDSLAFLKGSGVREMKIYDPLFLYYLGG